ncbi:MAG TPA: HAMP domain-containing sensor histidine kinase [Rugosimonospora sp.]|jgi:two-component system sensor histidine kinase MtrB
MRGRLILGFVSVALLTSVATFIATYVAAAYLFRNDRLQSTSHLVNGLLPNDPTSGQIALIVMGCGIALLALMVVLAQLATRRVLRPVRKLAAVAGRLAEGDLHIRLTATGADEMTDLVHAFNEMASSLQAKVEELHRMHTMAQRFAGDVSHELRTPLAAMLAVTDVLDEQSERFDGDAAAAARLVSRETSNLNRLVADLIEISRFDAGSAALLIDAVNLADAVRSCLRVRGWTPEIVVEPLPDLLVRADPRRLDVIIANLVGNALRHGAPPVTVRAWTHRTAGRDWVSLRVNDRGPGMPAEVLPHVFDRFYKADTARTRSEGSGLGLAIAWENARLHEGTIEATNAPEGGAAFTLHLPVAAGPVHVR